MKLASQNLKRLGLFVSLILTSSLAIAGPPFITEDPDPAPFRELQLYLYTQVISASHTTVLGLPVLELDYGYIKDLELHLVIPFLRVVPTGAPRAVGFGDFETWIKYQFLEETKYLPKIAIAPTYYVPIGDANRNLGNGRPYYKLPIWIGKTIEKWYLYGGGGYTYNPAPTGKNFYFGGFAVQRTISDAWVVGGEIYGQGQTSRTLSPPMQDSGAFTLFDLGVGFAFNKKTAVLFAAGHSISGVNQWYSYLGLYHEFDTFPNLIKS